MSSAKSFLRLSALLLCMALASRRVHAQDFYHAAASAESASRAGIYTPDAANVIDALSRNPAGLTAIVHPTANSLLFSGIAWGSFSNPANQDSAMRLRPGFVPFGAVGMPLGAGRWRVALGFTPDLLSSLHWHYADSPGTAGVDYGPQPEKSAILAYRLSPGVAFPLTARLSFGASVGLIYNENALIAPYIFQENPQLQGLKTLLALGTRGFGWGGGIGLTLRPAQHLELSAGWTSPVTINSHGHASGNMGAQFQALGIPFQPDFIYRASVKVKLPQTVSASGRWQATRSLGLNLQGDFTNYRTAFNRLPIHLTDGNNPDINGFLASDSFRDQVPLRWSDQLIGRVAIDRTLGERFKLNAGYVQRSSLVPDGTVTPLTGPIMKHGLSTGLEYDRGTLRLAAAYAVNFDQTARVATSGLLAGEYNNSRLTVGTQALTVGAAWRIRPPDRSRP